MKKPPFLGGFFHKEEHSGLGRSGFSQVQLNEALGPSSGGGLFAADGGVARRPLVV